MAGFKRETGRHTDPTRDRRAGDAASIVGDRVDELATTTAISDDYGRDAAAPPQLLMVDPAGSTIERALPSAIDDGATVIAKNVGSSGTLRLTGTVDGGSNHDLTTMKYVTLKSLNNVWYIVSSG